MFQQSQINEYFSVVNKIKPIISNQQSDVKVTQKGCSAGKQNKVQNKIKCVANKKLKMPKSDITECTALGSRTEPERRYLPKLMVISSDDDDFQEKKIPLRICKTSPKTCKTPIAKKTNKRKVRKRLIYDDSSEISSQKSETAVISEIKNNTKSTTKIDVISNVILQRSTTINNKTTENNNVTPYTLISHPSTSKEIFSNENPQILNNDSDSNNTKQSKLTQHSPSTSNNASVLTSTSIESNKSMHSQLTQNNTTSLNTEKEKDSLQSTKNVEHSQSSESNKTIHNQLTQNTNINMSKENQSERAVQNNKSSEQSDNSTSKDINSQTNTSTRSALQTNNAKQSKTSSGTKVNTLKGKQRMRPSQNSLNKQKSRTVLRTKNNNINIQHKANTSNSQISEDSEENTNKNTKSDKTISFEVSISNNSPPKITIHGNTITAADTDYNIIIQTPGIAQKTTNESNLSTKKDLNVTKTQSVAIQTSPITSDENIFATPIKQVLNKSVKRNLNSNLNQKSPISSSSASEDENIPVTKKSVKQIIASILEESKNLNKSTQISKRPSKNKFQDDPNQMTLTQYVSCKKSKITATDIETPKSPNTADVNDMSNNLRCENVKKIINWVFGKEFFKILFTKREEDLLNKLLNLPNPQHRIVCLRLLTLEHKWYNLSNLCEKFNLNIETIQLQEMLDVLKSDFVETDYSGEDVILLLNHLSALDVRSICSSFKLKLTSNNKKPANITLLHNHSLHQKTLTTLKTTEQILRDRVNKKLGICVKLTNEFRDILFRIHLLYSFTNSNIITLNDIYFLMERLQNGKFIHNKIDSTLVFNNRKQYERYYKAWKLWREFDEEVEKNNIHNQHLLSKQAFIELKELLEDHELVTSDKYKPLFLRRFSAPSIYCAVISSASQNLGKHHPADLCEWLEMLLKQHIYCTHKRGVWYTQLSLIKHAHLKDISSAVETIIAGLSDKLVSEIGRHELSIRGSKINKTKISQMLYDQLQCVLLPACEILEPRTIQARVAHNYKKSGKLVFVIDTEDGKEYRSVEETAIRHYKTQLNYTDGLHCEGRLLVKLFYIFFWDIIFNEHVPNTFLTEIQHFPLDLSSGEFYMNRKRKIDNRLKDIREEWNLDIICQFLSSILKNHAAQIAMLTNILNAKSRDVTSLESDKDDYVYHVYVRCIGKRVLSAIFERFVKNFKQFQSGLPDLFLWNKKEFKCCFVEVKSENDILSTSQILWLNYLRSVGANAEVCRVESIGSSSRKGTKAKR